VNNILEIENALHILEQKKIENLFNAEFIDWHYSYSNPSLDSENFNAGYKNHTFFKESPVFFHLFHQKNGVDHSELYKKFIKQYDLYNTFYKLLEKHAKKNITIIRIMGVLIPPNPSYDGLCMVPHTDWDIPHKTCIYYVNNSDGDTYFFSNDIKNKQNIEPIYKVQPKRGKICLFDGLTHHSSNVSKTTTRMVLNVNFIEQDTL
jgi:hypothetical protein